MPSIVNKVVWGLKLSKCGSVKAAYANAPTNPAPPVPDDQLEIMCLNVKMGETYLLWTHFE